MEIDCFDQGQLSSKKELKVQPSPFFIVGSGRSGTTLLRAILDARDDVRIPGETHFFTTYRIENLFRYHFLTRANYRKAVKDYKLWRHVNYEILDWDKFRSLALELPPKRASILKAYLLACGYSKEVSFIGEKTPGHIRQLNRIWADFPSSKVIHVTRDPRAVAASYLKHSLYASVYGSDVTRAAKKWREAAEIDEKISQSGHAEKYLLVTYEDLVIAPERTLSRINDFLGLPEVPCLLERYLESTPSLSSTFNHQQIGKPINLESLHSWKSVLVESDIALIEAICGKYLQLQQYPLSGVRSISSIKLALREFRFYLSFVWHNGRRLVRSFSK